MQTAQNKGKELESSVYYIQKTILETDPQYRGLAFTISRNEIVDAGGVRHEIDITVRVSPGTDYEAKLIFECKNWESKVSKNEVIVLCEKIDALAAARGFLVAKAFSADAEAQARKDPRVKLVRCSSEFEDVLSFRLVHTQADLLNIDVHARIVGEDRQACDNGPLSHHDIWFFQGNPVRLGEVIKQFADRCYDEHFKRERERLSLEGTHIGSAASRVEFDPGELRRHGSEFEWMHLTCHYQVTNTPCRVRSRFKIHGYGRTYSFEPVEKDGEAAHVTIVIRASGN